MIEITIEKIKKALQDSEFRNLFPHLEEEIDQWIENPGCKCNTPLYNTILSDITQLRTYFGAEMVVVDQPLSEIDEQVNQWSVINCTIDELQERLAELPPGPKQISLARFEDQITCIVNDPIF